MAQFQLAEVDSLLKNQINLQNLRNRTSRVGIAQQRANTGSQNANTNRVNSLVKAGDYEAAEKIYENEPGNKAKDLTFKFSPKEKILTVKQIRNGQVIGSKSFSYNPHDVAGSMQLLPEASFESEPGLGSVNLSDDRAELTRLRQQTKDPAEISRINEVLEEMNRGSGFRNDIWSAVKKNNPGDLDKAIKEFNKIESGLSGARGGGRLKGVAESQSLPEVQQAAQDFAEAKATGSTLGSSIPAQFIKPFAVMDQSVELAKELQTEFTPQELAAFAGPVDLPVNKVAQSFRNDPKFAAFAVKISKLKLLAFGEGGKQLTPFEAEVVFGTVVTGEEWSTADVVAKLEEIIRRVPQLKNQMIHNATITRGQLKREAEEASQQTAEEGDIVIGPDGKEYKIEGGIPVPIQ